MSAPEVIGRMKVIRCIGSAGVGGEIPIARCTTLAAHSERPAQVPCKLAIKLTEERRVLRAVAACDDRVGYGRRRWVSRIALKNTGARVVQGLFERECVHADEPVDAPLATRAQANFDALGAAVAILQLGVIVNVRRPQARVSPVTVVAEFDIRLRSASDDGECSGAEPRVA